MKPRLPGLLAVLCLTLPALGAGVVPAAAQTVQTEHTLAREEGAPPPPASMADVAWLAGRWVGEGLGAAAEEVWMPPAGGAMVGVFRLVREGSPQFYELVTMVEEEGSVVLRLKHFGPDLVGWEAKGESVSFPLVRRDADTLWFDGLTIRRVGADRMRIWVALESEGEVREGLFEYRRASPSSGGG